MEVIPPEERVTIRAVAMDVAAAFAKVCDELPPNADKVYDKFHIVNAPSEAMWKVQSDERKELMRQWIAVFKHTRHLFSDARTIEARNNRSSSGRVNLSTVQQNSPTIAGPPVVSIASRNGCVYPSPCQIVQV
jgi:transposase